MNILDKIVEQKKAEVKELRGKISLADLERRPFFQRKTLSLKEYLLDENKSGIIAEFKRKSPSRGIINDRSAVADITRAYTASGASGLSVLTDGPFFGGSAADLAIARTHQIPILRKDFIIDEFQVAESRAMGADLILLIAACLSPESVQKLATLARSLQLEVLLEIHNKEELGHICDEVDLVGVNNRDLKTFTVNINRSVELSGHIPANKISIAESGISDVNSIQRLKRYGFKGFLIGEHFMKEADPAIAFASFVNQLKNVPHEDKSLWHDPTRPGQKTG